MLKIRRPLGRLIFNMGIAIPGKTVFLIETAPWAPCSEGDGSIHTPVFISLRSEVSGVVEVVVMCVYTEFTWSVCPSACRWHGFRSITPGCRGISNFVSTFHVPLSGKLTVFSCDQAALRTPFSVCPSVTPFSLCCCHRIATKFSGVILTQIGRFRTVTPVWIHQWLRNYA